MEFARARPLALAFSANFITVQSPFRGLNKWFTSLNAKPLKEKSNTELVEYVATMDVVIRDYFVKRGLNCRYSTLLARPSS